MNKASRIPFAAMGRTSKTRRNRYGAWLHYLRKNKNLSQAEVAKQTGIARTTLMHWERTGKLVGRKQIIELAKLYEVSIPELLRADEDSKAAD